MIRLITIMMIFTSSILFGQTVVDSTVVQTSTTERVIDKYGGKLIEGFEKLVSSVTPVAKQGFEIAVRKNIAEGIVRLIPLISLLIFLTLFKNEYDRINKMLISDRDEYSSYIKGPFSDDYMTPLLLIYLIVTCLSIVATAFCIHGAIVMLIAPEWYALKDIIELIK